MWDVLIVGAGFSGSVMAERLARAGKQVLIVEQRNHIGGNAFDYYDEHGILVHKYGPHIFHTNSKRVVEYLSQFTEWRPYEHRVLANVDGQLVPMPINARTLSMIFGEHALAGGVEEFIRRVRSPITTARNAEESVLARMGQDVFEKFFKGYTEKQWGRPARELNPSVTARIPIRANYDDRYFTDRYQLMPKTGYSHLFEQMLNLPNIAVLLQTSWDNVRNLSLARKVVFTGPVDSFFGFSFGKLPYRSLTFEHTYYNKTSTQTVGTINFPNSYDYTRTTDMKYLTGQECIGTVVITEYPKSSGSPYYPVPADDTEVIYQRYKAEAEKLPHVKFLGRLGTYRYYNMDQVVAAALELAEDVLRTSWV